MGAMGLAGALSYPSLTVLGVCFCSRSCHRRAADTYHRYEGFVMADYLGTVAAGGEVGASGTMFMAFRAVVERPSAFYVTDEAREVMEKEEVDFDVRAGSKFRFLWNLCGHEGSQDADTRLSLAIRAIILLK